VRRIVDVLRGAGHVAYVVGGAVRDALRGLPPKDYDIATDAVPDRVAALFERSFPIGKAFGVMAVVSGGVTREVATFRSEEGYADGRRPGSVAFSDPATDALRRDFTVNALFYDPESGHAIDYAGGLADLRDGLLRAVGTPSARFAEDHLRLLRAVRFGARFGFSMETETAQALSGLAPLAAKVSAERQAQELSLMLAGGHARASFELLERHGLLAVVLPEVAALRGLAQPPQFHPEGDAWTHTLLMLGLLDESIVLPESGGGVEPANGETAQKNGEPIPTDCSGMTDKERVATLWSTLDASARLALAWAVLLHDIGKPGTYTLTDRIRFNDHDRTGALMAAELLRRLKRPEALVETVIDLVGRHMHFANLRRMRTAKLRRWMQENDAPLHLELHRLDCASSHNLLDNWRYGFKAWMDERSRPRATKPLINGRDLLALGIKSGPAIGQWLQKAKDAELEGEFNDRKNALTWLASQLQASGEPVESPKND